MKDIFLTNTLYFQKKYSMITTNISRERRDAYGSCNLAKYTGSAADY